MGYIDSIYKNLPTTDFSESEQGHEQRALARTGSTNHTNLLCRASGETYSFQWWCQMFSTTERTMWQTESYRNITESYKGMMCCNSNSSSSSSSNNNDDDNNNNIVLALISTINLQNGNKTGWWSISNFHLAGKWSKYQLYYLASEIFLRLPRQGRTEFSIEKWPPSYKSIYILTIFCHLLTSRHHISSAVEKA
jgi:hypothetical protein